MAKKKPAAKTKVIRKAAVRKKKALGRSSTRTATKKVRRTTKTSSVKSPKSKTATKAAVKRVVRVKAVKKKSASLGRPRIPADSQLDLVFKSDYQAREVFGFLNVHTIRELEQHDPREVIETLTSPLVQTVNRIRKALAINNRHMKGDVKFAREFQESLKGV